MVVNDLDTNLTKVVLTQLAVEDALNEEFCQLSLNAISGTVSGQAMRLQALVDNKVMLVLVDSGSSHNFVSSAFLQNLNISASPAVPR